MLDIRPFQPQDWDILLHLANQAVPFAPLENEEWLAYRRAFDEVHRLRRHYLAWQGRQPAGYGGLEQQGDDLARLRIYVVAAPADLASAVGQGLLAHLVTNARQLGVTRLWARELEADLHARAFFIGQGFVATQRAAPPNFASVVVFERALT